MVTHFINCYGIAKTENKEKFMQNRECAEQMYLDMYSYCGHINRLKN